MGKHTREISWVSYFNDEFSLVAFIEDLYQSPGDHVVACSSSSVLAGIIQCVVAINFLLLKRNEAACSR